MWEITVKLRPIPSSARNPRGSRDGHVQYVEIRETGTPEQMQIGGSK